MRPLPVVDAPTTAGVCELILNREHLDRVVAGIGSAHVSVDLMTADLKAMLIPSPQPRGRARSIIALLRDLADKGVEVRLLHAGVPSSAALAELRQVRHRKAGWPENLSIRRCPRLHAKVVIIDAAAMYLGSANLTGAGLGAKGPSRRNFEAGIWTRSQSMIDAISGQFNALWEGHECEACGRRDVCPEPLEEPEL